MQTILLCLCIVVSVHASVAQLVQHLPRTQKIVGSSSARGSSSFSLEKKELSSGVVACICLVSITDYSCVIHEVSCEISLTAPNFHRI